MSHTPGPWRVVGNHYGSPRVVTDTPTPGRGPEYEAHIVVGSSEWTYLTDADATLIAEAPALLEMLEKIVNRVTRPTQDSTGQNMVSVREALIDEARTVIARAKGQS
jgi:hypothetical protein